MQVTSPTKHITFANSNSNKVGGNPIAIVSKHVSANHIENFKQNLLEVQQLMMIHSAVSGTTPGRKRQVQTLNKSAIVLLTACWESYIEDLASASFDILMLKSTDHDKIPQGVRVKASREIKQDKDETTIWKLAGNGWKVVLSDYKEQILKKEIDFFHSPRPDNIDNLYEKLLGMKAISNKWKWKKMTNENCKKKLNRFIDLRGGIAHSVKTDKQVLKKDVTDYSNFLNSLAVLTHNNVVEFLETVTGDSCWERVKYGDIE